MSKYPAPILSMGVSPKGDTIVVGMSNGALMNRIHTKEQKKGDRFAFFFREPTLHRV